MKWIIKFSFLLCLINVAHSQNNYRSVGFNTNPILAQILPFNNIPSSTSLYSIIVRNYGTSNSGIRTGFGVQLSEFLNQNAFLFSIGWETRRKIKGKLFYITGVSAAIEFIEDNQTVSFFGNTDMFGGCVVHWGIEYRFNDLISLSTESRLRLGLGDFGPSIKLDAPQYIVAHFNISKK